MYPGGRGNLIRHFLESQSEDGGPGSSNDSTDTPSDPSEQGSFGRGSAGREKDSGDSGLDGSPLFCLPRAFGRGRIVDLISKSSDSSGSSVIRSISPSLQISGRGRPQFMLDESKVLRRSEKILATTYSSSGIEVSQFKDDSEFSEFKDDSQSKDAVIEGIKDIKIDDKQQQDTEEEAPVIKRGTAGVVIDAATNYIRLHSDKNKGVFEYEVRFDPNIHSRAVRMKLLNEHKEKFGGTKTFDGTTLYLPILLSDKITIFESIQVEERIEIKLIYKRKKPLKDCIHLYNVLFDRVMRTLNYVRCQRKQFDPSAPKIIPQHKLEIWPGYITAVDEYEDGVMLCCDVSHRVLSTQTVLEFMKNCYRKDSQGFQENIKKSIIGSVIMTRYNNKTYRIDDIDFNSNPQSTFRSRDKDIKYIDYYKSHYDIEINDFSQPLLISIEKRRVSNKESMEEIRFCLIPEICYLTGLSDELRNDFKVLKDVATFTRVTPNQRILALKKFYTNVNGSKEAKEILDNWGLRLENNVENIKARQLPEEIVTFAHKKFSVGVNADFGKYSTNNQLIEVVNLNNWVLVYMHENSNIATNFIEHMERNSRPMGIVVSKPRLIVAPNDRTDTYVTLLRQSIKSETQIVVLIVPTSRDDRYSSIKKICCAEIPVPSQVINARTLKNEAKNRSIVQKIALQINCKLGGSLWSINIPLPNAMICGIDSYHDAGRKGNSVAAFVASTDSKYTKWYSRAVIQTKSEEIVNGLSVSLKMALENYKKVNGKLPDKIIIFRDGVGDGQLPLVRDYEIPQLEKACDFEKNNYKPKITFIVVQKRINTRVFFDSGKELVNPNPGVVVDHTITRRFMFDFFLIPQSVRQGTVTPSHFIVVYDTAKMEPDIIQRLSYKLCFLYYNWPGTVRVPACCQYAHKLAYLVGENVKRPTSETLANKLFYL